MRHSATEHPISWFVDREIEGNLTLRPDFQRRLVWADRQKSNLIESILLEIPIPEIYMQTVTDPLGKSDFIVVDGQQRINTILEFVGIGEREPFELNYLDPNSYWTGCTFAALTDEQKGKFYNHSMAVRNLYDANTNEIEELFRRLNINVVPLNPQELRNATYQGPLLRLSEMLAEDSFWSENRLATPDAIRRMRDIEFVSDLLISVLHGPRSGNRQTLDDYYTMYEDHEPEFPDQDDAKRRFTRTLELIDDIVPDLRKSRWTNKTDFYSLFVVISHLLRDHVLTNDGADDVRGQLADFETHVRMYQDDEDANVPEGIVDYVEAVRRGSSDQHRRGTRHQVLIELLTPSFKVSSR